MFKGKGKPYRRIYQNHNIKKDFFNVLQAFYFLRICHSRNNNVSLYI